MAILADVADKEGVRVGYLEDGVGVVTDWIKPCGLRYDAEEYFAEYNSRAAVADWGNPSVRTAMIREAKNLAIAFCEANGVDYREYSP